MDKRLSEVIGTEPGLTTRPIMEAVYLWLLRRCTSGQDADALLCTTVLEGSEDIATPSITRLRNAGFAVMVKPQRSRTGTVDFTGDILARIDELHGSGRLAEVIVASHDGAAFADRLEELAGSGVSVAVLGFREKAGYAAHSRSVEFIDLEDVPNVFAQELPRTNLFDLPSEGKVLQPLRRPRLNDFSPEPARPPAATPAAAPTTPPPAAPTPTAASPNGGGLGQASAPTPAFSPPPSPPPASTPAPSMSPPPDVSSGIEDEPEPAPSADAGPTRSEVLDAIVELVRDRGSQGVAIDDLGAELDQRIVGFEPEGAGFGSIDELADVAARERGLRVDPNAIGGARLRPGGNSLDELLSGIRPTSPGSPTPPSGLG